MIVLLVMLSEAKHLGYRLKDAKRQSEILRFAQNDSKENVT
jgi:hypothetical protein